MKKEEVLVELLGKSQSEITEERANRQRGKLLGRLALITLLAITLHQTKVLSPFWSILNSHQSWLVGILLAASALKLVRAFRDSGTTSAKDAPIKRPATQGTQTDEDLELGFATKSNEIRNQGDVDGTLQTREVKDAKGECGFFFPVSSMPEGKGRMEYKDGRVFVGEYKQGDMVKGKMTYMGNSFYEGRWRNGMRHGNGKFVFVDGTVYRGQFRDGLFCGNGTMTMRDGGWYKGQWRNGKMHGRGKVYRADGAFQFEDEWNNGRRTFSCSDTVLAVCKGKSNSRKTQSRTEVRKAIGRDSNIKTKKNDTDIKASESGDDINRILPQKRTAPHCRW